jgi:hypothetical protein
VNGPPDAQAFATAMGPALGNLMTPMSKFVGQANVWQNGVSVKSNTVTVSSQQMIKAVNVYAAVRAPLFAFASVLTRRLASHDVLDQGFRSGRRSIP